MEIPTDPPEDQMTRPINAPTVGYREDRTSLPFCNVFWASPAAGLRSDVDMVAAVRKVVERRAFERYTAKLAGKAEGRAWKHFDVSVRDLSSTGLSMSWTFGLSLGDVITLKIDGLGRREATIVRNAGPSMGCEFLSPLTELELSRVLNPRSATIIQFPVPASLASEREVFVNPLPRWQRGSLIVALGFASWLLVLWIAFRVWAFF
ncbi:PilZ domain-containing protein [bacterium]|nr:MAG: PilZ domain-containing protein [bacterium]